MTTPFLQAWDILKYFKNPHDEERDYGRISSNMDNPMALARMPGFHRDTRNERERILDDITLPDMPQPSRTMPMERELDTSDPPNPFLMREREPEVDPMVQALEELSRKRRDVSTDSSPMKTIPMSPRGSVKGMGERQAFDKPKKLEWWRGN